MLIYAHWRVVSSSGVPTGHDQGMAKFTLLSKKGNKQVQQEIVMPVRAGLTDIMLARQQVSPLFLYLSLSTHNLYIDFCLHLVFFLLLPFVLFPLFSSLSLCLSSFISPKRSLSIVMFIPKT